MKRVIYTEFTRLLKQAQETPDLFEHIHELSIVVWAENNDLNTVSRDELNARINEHLKEEHRKEFIFSRMVRFSTFNLHTSGETSDVEVNELKGQIYEGRPGETVLLGQQIDWHQKNILPFYYKENVVISILVTDTQRDELLLKQNNQIMYYEN